METVLLDFDRIKIIEPHETESVFITLESMRKLWLQRTNWHPALEIAGPDSILLVLLSTWMLEIEDGNLIRI